MIPDEFFYDEYDPALEKWLEDHFGKEVFSPRPNSLDKFFSPIKEEIQKLGVPILTVAGTNGKGEVAQLIEGLLLENGYQTLLWTSPHILTVRERFSFSGRVIENSRLFNIFKKLEKTALELSYYEFLFLCFCQLSLEEIKASEKAIFILEVGLGGRLDATNFFDAGISILTSIGRDHMDILGPTLADVLREKIAISRPNKPLICAIQQSFLKDLARDYCLEHSVELHEVTSKKEATFKEVNLLTSIEAVKVFFKNQNISAYSLKIPNKLWARPFEVTYKSCQFILVGSHNLDGLRHLAKWVNDKNDGTCGKFDELWIGLSRKPGKELDQCLSLIHQSPCLGDVISFAGFDHTRATPIEAIKESWSKLDQGRKVRFEESWRVYLQNISNEQRILVCGSYFFIGDVLKNSDLLHFL